MKSPKLLVAFITITVCTASIRAEDEPKLITPTETIELFNHRDLSGWYTWLQDTHREDPRKVFTVQSDGVLRISGDGFGGLTTKNEYRDYHLTIEYRWGELTWAPRKEKSRDGGLLLHCQGPDGNYRSEPGKPAAWMTSIECQIIEGGVGDILVLQGRDKNFELTNPGLTSEITRDRDGEAVWTVGGEKTRFAKGRINWFGRDPDWKDVLGVRGPKDVDSRHGEWTRLECYCDGDKLTYVVNGTVVNRASEVTPNQGKILLQTECAELFVRRLDLAPLPAKRP